MPRLEPFCSIKLFPLRSKEEPIKKGFFFFSLKRMFFWLHLGFYDLRQMRVEEVIYEKGYFFLFIFTFYEGVSLLSGLSSHAYQGNGILAPI